MGYRVLRDGVRLPRATVSRIHRRLHALQRAYAAGSLELAAVRAAVSGLAGHARPAGAEAVLAALLHEHGWVRTRHADEVDVDADDRDDDEQEHP